MERTSISFNAISVIYCVLLTSNACLRLGCVEYKGKKNQCTYLPMYPYLHKVVCATPKLSMAPNSQARLRWQIALALARYSRICPLLYLLQTVPYWVSRLGTSRCKYCKIAHTMYVGKYRPTQFSKIFYICIYLHINIYLQWIT